jgi:hypothetical protein
LWQFGLSPVTQAHVPRLDPRAFPGRPAQPGPVRPAHRPTCLRPAACPLSPFVLSLAPTRRKAPWQPRALSLGSCGTLHPAARRKVLQSPAKRHWQNWVRSVEWDPRGIGSRGKLGSGGHGGEEGTQQKHVLERGIPLWGAWDIYVLHVLQRLLGLLLLGL